MLRYGLMFNKSLKKYGTTKPNHLEYRPKEHTQATQRRQDFATDSKSFSDQLALSNLSGSS